MKNPADFLDYSLVELKNAFYDCESSYKCMICGREFEKGRIFKHEDQFYESWRYAQIHVRHKHGSAFSWLLGLDKKQNGLSEHQSQLLELFYQGLSDQQIQQKLKIGSTSTIRNHRFLFKEKERQAKIYLALMQLLHERESQPEKFIEPHQNATMVDDRYKVTAQEREKILKKLFPDGLECRLKTFAVKEKSKLVVLRHISQRFEADRMYSEKEVNEILKEVYDDYVMLRRYLIEYGFIDREDDGSRYWLKQ